MKLILYGSAGNKIIEEDIDVTEAFQLLNILKPAKFPSYQEFINKWVIKQ